jgi:hypothetical protein
MEIRAHVRWSQPKVELGLGQKSLRCRAFYGNKGPCEVEPTQSGIRFRVKKLEV